MAIVKVIELVGTSSACQDGALTITLPKTEEAKSHKVAISG